MMCRVVESVQSICEVIFHLSFAFLSPYTRVYKLIYVVQRARNVEKFVGKKFQISIVYSGFWRIKILIKVVIILVKN